MIVCEGLPMKRERRLHQLGLELPPAPKPVGAYVPAVRSGNLVFVSGQLPMRDGELLVKGRVGGPSTTLPVESLWVERGAALSLSPLDHARGDPECVEGSKGDEVSVEEARTCARQAALNALAAVAGELGSLRKVRRVVRLTGYVASAPGFTDQALVLNAASELLVEVFGEAGRHSRAAVGAAELPLGAPVELELVVEANGFNAENAENAERDGKDG